jgi:hypothetical protein
MKLPSALSYENPDVGVGTWVGYAGSARDALFAVKSQQDSRVSVEEATSTLSGGGSGSLFRKSRMTSLPPDI